MTKEARMTNVEGPRRRFLRRDPPDDVFFGLQAPSFCRHSEFVIFTARSPFIQRCNTREGPGGQVVRLTPPYLCRIIQRELPLQAKIARGVRISISL